MQPLCDCIGQMISSTMIQKPEVQDKEVQCTDTTLQNIPQKTIMALTIQDVTNSNVMEYQHEQGMPSQEEVSQRTEGKMK